MECIKKSELISDGYNEVYYETFICPVCKYDGLSDTDNYCSNCGLKIIDDKQD